MLSIGSSPPVCWSTAPLAVAVPSVPALGAVGSSARAGQNGAGHHGQGTQSGAAAGSRNAHEGRLAGAQAAPLLPREQVEDRASVTATEADEARRRAEQLTAQAQQARDKAEQKPQLQAVLASVWKASAAVVNVLLGRGPGAAATGDGAAPGALDPLAPEGRDADPDPAEWVARREPDPPAAYTEQGTSSWAPMASGQLLDRRA